MVDRVERVAIVVVAIIDDGPPAVVERRIRAAREAGADQVETMSVASAAASSPVLVGTTDIAWAIIDGAREIRTRQVRPARRVADVLGAILAARERSASG